ncbi:MAG TPA: hypothetical protein VM052_07780 [Candidatus Limnocylindrales bacterium]|nr:hypothetical protein [Candidatus Limnocylindrales bacterium]
MKRIQVVLATLAFFVAISLQSGSALAGHQWCEEDPQFLVNGALVDVTTVFPASYADKVSNVHFDLQVPSNALAVVVSLPGTVPVTASISRTLPAYYGLLSVPVVLTVTMKTTTSFTHSTFVTGLAGKLLNTVYGASTSPMKAKFKMYGVGLL